MEETEPKPAPAGAGRSWLAAGAAAVLLSRLAFLPSTLEDLDSTNFAHALLDYDPARHQPHPPGYPIYVALAKAVHALVAEPVRALAVLSGLAQAGLLPAFLALFRALSPQSAVVATLLTITNPTLWFNGARPMSDSVGLLFIVTTQALLLRELQRPGRLPLASLLVGLTPGVRVQSVILTGPLWLLVLWRSPGRRLRGLAMGMLGALSWALPLVAYS